MNRSGLWIRVLAVGVVLVAMGGAVNAATPEQIDQSITSGVAWLAGAQQADGSWGSWEQAAQTCFALVKLQERAYDLGLSPFETDYVYEPNVVRGWQYLFGNQVGAQNPLPQQLHNGTLDDPDSNSNGYGLFFSTWGSRPNYTTGICLMALAASGTPNRANDAGADWNGDGNADTFAEVAQEAVDWLAFAQGDRDWCEGGWGYGANDNACDWSDQSNSGYSLLGLAYAEGMGCSVPGWVRTELAVWTAAVQNGDGGAGYEPGGGSNELRTGNLLTQLCFNGKGPGDADYDNALGYVQDNWLASNNDPGWGYGLGASSYQTMYCVMKGLQYCRIDQIDYEGDGEPEDWFNQEPPAVPREDYASTLIQQQHGDGAWRGCDWGSDELCTSWALLVLEKVAPPPPNEPPDCSAAAPSITSIWPANHKWVPIAIQGVTDPDGDPVTVTVTGIRQDEPVDTYGDGRFTPDGKGVGTAAAEVRAERSGTAKVPGNGRVYHITFSATDPLGESCSGEVLVAVPHDMKKSPVDNGPLYDSTVVTP